MRLKISPILAINKKHKILPNILILSLITQFFIYYYTVFNGTYPEVMWLVIISNIFLVIGYFIGSNITIKLRKNNIKLNEVITCDYNYNFIRKAAFMLIFIGIVAHLFFYSSNLYSSYADSYTVSRGQGFITAFFNFLLVGMILLETLSIYDKNNSKTTIFNRILMIIYSLVYFFVFLKRRQIIILLLSVVALKRDKINKKILIWATCFLIVILFTIYGKIRGYISSNGFNNIISVLINDFSIEWIQFDNFEGKYISRTLYDVYNYVSNNGIDISIIYGIVCCLIPRFMFEDSTKPVAFPEWYTMHFFPADFARGTGYAGSMIAELYLIGWIPLVIIGFLFIGYLFAKLEKLSNDRNNILDNIIYSISIYNIIVLPRYDLASILIDFIFLYLPVIFIMKKATMRNLS